MNPLRILVPSVLITGVILAALHSGVAAPPFAGVPVNPIPEPDGSNLFRNGYADPTYLPIPETAKVFLDPVEMILQSAPGSALEKLRNETAAEDAVVELNRYFGQNVVNRSIVLHTTVEEALAHPDPRNVFRIRAASTPLKWEGGTMQRLSYLYFKAADGPKAASVKVGSEIIVVGWVRKCLVEKTEEGLRLDFDLQYSKIEDASAPLQ